MNETVTNFAKYSENIAKKIDKMELKEAFTAHSAYACSFKDAYECMDCDSITYDSDVYELVQIFIGVTKVFDKYIMEKGLALLQLCMLDESEEENERDKGYN